MNNVWYFGTATGFAYIIPNVDCVILGGTTQKGDWNTTVSREDTETIMRNVTEVFPSLGEAPVVSYVLSGATYEVYLCCLKFCGIGV
jgi:glycine/D-amino acid oxidase-like deaminating enzyme